MKPGLIRELLLFAAFAAGSYLLLPFAVYTVGGFVFGDYDGGYGTFFSTLTSRLLSGQLSMWFLILSPWFVVQVIRLTLLFLRKPNEKTA